MIRHSTHSICLLLLAAALLVGAPAIAAAEPQLPTLADLKEMYDSGAYRTCLQQAARLMQLRPDHPSAVDRGQLALLRGQSLLALEDSASAIRVLQEAQESKDPEVGAHARALIALIRSSPKLRYVPRTRDAAPASANSAEGINIADPRTRREAFFAFLNDQIASFEADARKAIAADNLNPSIALVPRMVELHAVERLATDKDERIGPIARQVGEHARELINRELDTQDKKIANVERVANQLIDVPGGGSGWWLHGITRRGLNSDERQDLYDLIQYLQRVVETSQQALNVAQSVNGNVQAWQDILTRAQTVREHAQNVLDAEGFRSGTGDTSGIGR